MKLIRTLVFLLSISALAQAAPILVKTNFNQFVQIRDDGEDGGDRFIKLDQIVSIEVSKSDAHDGFHYRLTIHTAATAGKPSQDGSGLSGYDAAFKTREEADLAANHIMTSILTLGDKG